MENSQRINKKCERRKKKLTEKISPKKQYQRQVIVLVGSVGQQCWHQQPLLGLSLLMFQTPWLYSMQRKNAGIYIFMSIKPGFSSAFHFH